MDRRAPGSQSNKGDEPAEPPPSDRTQSAALARSTPECSICQNTRFIPAPGNRLSRKGLPPVCSKCRSLERHRIGRAIVNRIRVRDLFRRYRLLQFSDDHLVARGWFASMTLSIFGKQNSIDIQNIGLPDSSYDFIVCSHVLEHVADHRRAVIELTRILSNDGLMLLAYPSPITREKTEDWGYPDWNQHGHYRIFGRDFESEYRKLIPHAAVIAANGTDLVTGDDDLIYFVTKNPFWVERLLELAPKDARLIEGTYRRDPANPRQPQRV